MSTETDRAYRRRSFFLAAALGGTLLLSAVAISRRMVEVWGVNGVLASVAMFVVLLVASVAAFAWVSLKKAVANL